MSVVLQRRWQNVSKSNVAHLIVSKLSQPSVSCHFWGHITTLADGGHITFRCIPTVTITKTKSNNEVLVEIIRSKFGVTTFTSRQLAEHAATDHELRAALGSMDAFRIGLKLRGIKSIEAVHYERHLASWKVGPS